MSPALLLTIDVGNSRTKFGLFEAVLPGSWPLLKHAVAIPHGESWPWAEICTWTGTDGPSLWTVAAGVNPPALARLLADWSFDGTPPRVLLAQDLPLTVRLPAPERVGIDRLLNAVAGNMIRPAGRSLILIDSGTATTVDFVDENGAFVGGTILPGFELMARSLHAYTALLPKIDVAELPAAGPAPLGQDTMAALASGIFWGQVGAVRELTARLSAGAAAPPLILLTGGAAHLLAPHLTGEVRLIPDLPLLGLAIAARPETVAAHRRES